MGKRILVIESGIPVIPFEQSLLLRKDHEVSRAQTAAEALERVAELTPDLIITDERVSGMELPELIRQIRSLREGRYSAIIVLSSEELEQEPKGVNMVLRKPISGLDFSQACQRLLAISARKDARLLVYVQVKGYLKSNLFLCNSLNLSSSGLLILTARKLKLGDSIRLQITLPLERDKVEVQGDIVREAKEVETRLNAYGVKFVDMEPAALERLSRFVDKELEKDK